VKYTAIIILLSLSACSAFKSKTQNPPVGLQATGYYFTIYGDTTMKKRVLLDSVTTNEKAIDTSFSAKPSDYLELVFKDKKGHTNSSYTIQHPLYIEVMFINDQNQISSHPVVLPHAGFALKKRPFKNDVSLEIYERITGREKRQIAIIPLQKY
jgi:hypothetical protein